MEIKISFRASNMSGRLVSWSGVSWSLTQQVTVCALFALNDRSPQSRKIALEVNLVCNRRVPLMSFSGDAQKDNDACGAAACRRNGRLQRRAATAIVAKHDDSAQILQTTAGRRA